jgi:hypothetical protein
VQAKHRSLNAAHGDTSSASASALRRTAPGPPSGRRYCERRAPEALRGRGATRSTDEASTRRCPSGNPLRVEWQMDWSGRKFRCRSFKPFGSGQITVFGGDGCLSAARVPERAKTGAGDLGSTCGGPHARGDGSMSTAPWRQIANGYRNSCRFWPQKALLLPPAASRVHDSVANDWCCLAPIFSHR